MEKYTMSDLYKKYDFLYKRGGNNSFRINFLKIRGIIVEEIESPYKQKKLYKIIDDSLFNKNWVSHPYYPNLELTQDGYFRNKETKVIYQNHPTQYGYEDVSIGEGKSRKQVHRLLMETFNPIENSEKYVVDHINGIRNDNRLENLRWVFQEKNMQFCDENQTEIGIEITRLIQKYGYIELLNKLKEL